MGSARAEVDQSVVGGLFAVSNRFNSEGLAEIYASESRIGSVGTDGDARIEVVNGVLNGRLSLTGGEVLLDQVTARRDDGEPLWFDTDRGETRGTLRLRDSEADLAFESDVIEYYTSLDIERSRVTISLRDGITFQESQYYLYGTLRLVESTLGLRSFESLTLSRPFFGPAPEEPETVDVVDSIVNGRLIARDFARVRVDSSELRPPLLEQTEAIEFGVPYGRFRDALAPGVPPLASVGGIAVTRVAEVELINSDIGRFRGGFDDDIERVLISGSTLNGALSTLFADEVMIENGAWIRGQSGMGARRFVIAGGLIDHLTNRAINELVIRGTNVTINGVAYSLGETWVPETDFDIPAISAILSDGTPLALQGNGGAVDTATYIGSVTVEAPESVMPEIGQEAEERIIRTGDRVAIAAGERAPPHTLVDRGGEMEIDEGGSAEWGLRALGSVDVAGDIGPYSGVFDGGQVKLKPSGSLGFGFTVHPGGELVIEGGRVAESIFLAPRSITRMTAVEDLTQQDGSFSGFGGNIFTGSLIIDSLLGFNRILEDGARAQGFDVPLIDLAQPVDLGRDLLAGLLDEPIYGGQAIERAIVRIQDGGVFRLGGFNFFGPPSDYGRTVNELLAAPESPMFVPRRGTEENPFDLTASPGTRLILDLTPITLAADWDGNRMFDMADVLAYIADFTGADPSVADFDGNGITNISDLFAFIESFETFGPIINNGSLPPEMP
ncbi:MAG: hypothetical protein AAGI17_10170 [Planctomycetota bacterium]